MNVHFLPFYPILYLRISRYFFGIYLSWQNVFYLERHGTNVGIKLITLSTRPDMLIANYSVYKVLIWCWTVL